MNNTQRQLKARKQQLAAVQRQIKSGAYSAEDVKILQDRAVALQRMVDMYSARAV